MPSSSPGGDLEQLRHRGSSPRRSARRAARDSERPVAREHAREDDRERRASLRRGARRRRVVGWRRRSLGTALQHDRLHPTAFAVADREVLLAEEATESASSSGTSWSSSVTSRGSATPPRSSPPVAVATSLDRVRERRRLETRGHAIALEANVGMRRERAPTSRGRARRAADSGTSHAGRAQRAVLRPPATSTSRRIASDTHRASAERAPRARSATTPRARGPRRPATPRAPAPSAASSSVVERPQHAPARATDRHRSHRRRPAPLRRGSRDRRGEAPGRRADARWPSAHRGAARGPRSGAAAGGDRAEVRPPACGPLGQWIGSRPRAPVIRPQLAVGRPSVSIQLSTPSRRVDRLGKRHGGAIALEHRARPAPRPARRARAPSADRRPAAAARRRSPGRPASAKRRGPHVESKQ